ncbi:MAG: transcription antitermination factor NusB [Spirochaetales bacterium]|nr:transcription antitermination factor NusB [Spirochaetales bacterium]
MGVRRKGRIIAFQQIYTIEFFDKSDHEIYDFSWIDEKNQTKIKPESLDFARLLIGGTLENLEVIDNTIKNHLERWDFSRLAKVDLANLRIGIYELLFLKDIPAQVAIDEAINIAKEFGSDDSYRFINGILDSVYKSQKNTKGH